MSRLSSISLNLFSLKSLLLIAFILTALFVRLYRLDQLLSFHYDQGRDALVIRKFLKEGKPFLVGPVTGLEGIYLGPLFYLVLIPLYALGGGNPVVPASVLSASQILCILILYYLGRKIGEKTAFAAVIIYSLSQPIVFLNRWLSNPPPILITSSILILALYKITQKNPKFWLVASLAIGASLQFESASAVFFIPSTLLFFLWQWKNRPSPKIALVSIFIFLLSLVPQLIFDFRHENILSRNFYRSIISERSFSGSLTKLFPTRVKFYRDSLGNKLFAYDEEIIKYFFPLLLILGAVTYHKWKSTMTNILLIHILPPLAILLFFQGNFGNVYDYHLSGIYAPFILLTSIFLTTRINIYSPALLVVFALAFSRANLLLLYNSLTALPTGSTHISLGNQMQAVDWIYTDSGDVSFNVDVYVPPVIPHAYDYLLLYRGDQLAKYPAGIHTQLLYTLYEQDPPHPERLAAWIERQNSIGRIEQAVTFGGITVERRSRLTKLPSP